MQNEVTDFVSDAESLPDWRMRAIESNNTPLINYDQHA